MGFLSFGKTATPKTLVPEATVSTKDIVARYEHLRPIRFRLNNEMVSRFPRNVLNEGATKLGMLHGGTFVFDSEDETSVLMDYCVYDVSRGGRNAVERYLCDSPPEPDSDEMACLHAMQHATYTMLVVLEVEAGVGCRVRNLFTGETQLLVDMALSRTAKHGTLIVTRLLDFGDFVATGGSALPMGILDDDDMEAWQRKFSRSVHDDHADPAGLIRDCLQAGSASHVRYEGGNTHRFDTASISPPVRHSAKERRALAKSRSKTPTANKRCRCGSGKMVKNCCGKG